jgi:hypothetical protein
LCDSFDGASEFSLDILQALRNSVFRFPGDQKAAMNRFLEGWFPSRVCRRSGNDSWISKARDSCSRIGKLAIGKKRITKIVCNTELKRINLSDLIAQGRSCQRTVVKPVCENAIFVPTSLIRPLFPFSL